MSDEWMQFSRDLDIQLTVGEYPPELDDARLLEGRLILRWMLPDGQVVEMDREILA